MHDLPTIAFQADLTRIATLLYARAGSNRVYPDLGFTDGHHPITHHRDIPDLVEKVTRINTHHVERFSHLIRVGGDLNCSGARRSEFSRGCTQMNADKMCGFGRLFTPLHPRV